MKDTGYPIFRPKFFGLFRKGHYSKKTFVSDLIAGVIVGVIALPLAIAFGIASGVSPEQGLITAIVAGFLISFFLRWLPANLFLPSGTGSIPILE